MTCLICKQKGHQKKICPAKSSVPATSGSVSGVDSASTSMPAAVCANVASSTSMPVVVSASVTASSNMSFAASVEYVAPTSRRNKQRKRVGGFGVYINQSTGTQILNGFCNKKRNRRAGTTSEEETPMELLSYSFSKKKGMPISIWEFHLEARGKPAVEGGEVFTALSGDLRNQNMGKVHGSLARAGKVRGQTPKVAKQDKKKKPRGRAHKRMQYNRRFVTAGNFIILLFIFTRVSI
nr:40S ribosomal protein S30 [Ipomoea batatas]